MNVIKFIGKVLALPIKTVMFVIALGLFPIKLLTNWLSGYGKYNRVYLKFFKITVKYMIEAVKRGEKPVLENIIQYDDNKHHIQLLNNKRCPHCSVCETEDGVLTKTLCYDGKTITRRF